MKRKKISVSIVIPTYNRIMKLFRLIKSLEKLNPIPDEIIIIDDNSIDGTKILLKKWKMIKKPYNKEVILKDENRGPADSRNLGILKARNDLIAFADDDVVVDTNWIKYITLDLLNCESNLVGIGGAVKSLANDILSRYYTEHKILEAPRNLNYLPTANCCFRKNALLKVGGFNTSFSFAGGEDTDLSLKLRYQGYYFKKNRKAVVYHDFSPNFIDFCKMWIRYGKGTELAIFKNIRRRK